MNFESFHFHSHIESGIKALGYTLPTSIQLQSIPTILQGRDVIGLAETGTGKTAAFVLPILQRLLSGPRKRLRALIMAPTRELAEQTHEAIKGLARYTKLKSVTIYGGVNKNPQIRGLHLGAEIAVACPGRLIDLMEQRAIDLSHVEVLVLDEADRMFDMGFLPDVRKIVKRLPVSRQTLLFSATMPDDIRDLVQEMLIRPVTFRIGVPGPVPTVSHALYPIEQHLKTALLMRLLKRTNTESVLVFTRTKHRATRLAAQMKRAGFLVASLQGDMTQQNRQEALSGFRSGRYRILVATDIAARGIDVSRISHVINYDMPDTVDAYTHRIGRTGRAERTGDAFTLVTPEDRDLVCSLERILGEKLPRYAIEDFDYTVPAPEGGRYRHSPYRECRNGSSIVTGQVQGAPSISGLPRLSKSDFRGSLPFSSPRPRARRARSAG